MNYKQLPNLLSVSRIILSVIFAYLFLETLTLRKNALLTIIVFILIILSDFFDGYLARKTGNTTHTGAFLDVISDMFFVLLSYSVLCLCGMLNIIFLAVLIIKFLEFIITSKLLKEKSPESYILFDTIGKNVSKIWIILPGLICLAYIFNVPNLKMIINIIMSVTSVLALLSTIYRITKLWRSTY